MRTPHHSAIGNRKLNRLLRPFGLYCASYSAQRFQRGCNQGGRWTELLITLRTGSLATTAYCLHCPEVEIAFCGVWVFAGVVALDRNRSADWPQGVAAVVNLNRNLSTRLHRPPDKLNRPAGLVERRAPGFLE
ncbi:NrsF family protein [Pseudomonas bohemica]|uniref:NrsF family protein n=1 Tax=Pseudomonas bohemica TaxID=2044872 RepID=UPI0038999AB5